VKNLRIAFIPLVRTTFDVALAEDMIRQARAALITAGLELTGPQGFVSDLPAAQAAAAELALTSPDLLLIFQATFADSTLITALAEAIDAPLLLWAVPEARTGGRLRLNSLCGINLAAHALKLRGRRYQYVYTAPDNAAGLDKVLSLAQAGRAARLLRGARLGIVGEHPAGLDTCHLDAPVLRSRFNLNPVQYQLADIFARAQRIVPSRISDIRKGLESHLDNRSALDQKPLNGTLSVYAALSQLADEDNLAGLAVRCWPEFFTELGCAACGAMSMLTNDQVPCSCEADVNGTVTQIILQSLSGESAFGSDLVSVEVENDLAVLWHCGLAPLSMADPDTQPHGGIHSNRKVPLVMEFPLKPGRVTLARLSQSAGQLRLVAGGGTMLPAPMSFSGTSGVIRFDRPAGEVLDTILREGLEHHLSLTYGDYLPALLAFAELMDLPVLRLC
jgi:L-fucose isomerase-like protein